jgi:colanic acid/amylovoran biosynthesis glycosyltransferase
MQVPSFPLPERVALTVGVLEIPPHYFFSDIYAAISTFTHAQCFAQRARLTPGTSLFGIKSSSGLDVRRVHRELMDFRPSLINQHWATWSRPARTVARRLGVPLVTSVHGYDAFLPASAGALRPLLDVIKRRDRDACLAQSDLVIVNSEFMLSVVQQLGIPESRIRVIRHSVDTRVFKPRAMGEPRRGILFVGRMTRQKGPMLLVEALGHLDSRSYDSLILIGDGPLRREVESMARKLGVPARFLGQRPRAQVAAELQRAKVVVVPSVPTAGQFEASGVVPLEAQACGAAVVVTRVGGLPENLPPGAQHLVAEPTPRSIADKVLQALSDQAPLREAATVKHILDRHSHTALETAMAKAYSAAITGA